jgi:hypothetical protein
MAVTLAKTATELHVSAAGSAKLKLVAKPQNHARAPPPLTKTTCGLVSD